MFSVEDSEGKFDNIGSTEDMKEFRTLSSSAGELVETTDEQFVTKVKSMEVIVHAKEEYVEEASKKLLRVALKYVLDMIRLVPEITDGSEEMKGNTIF